MKKPVWIQNEHFKPYSYIMDHIAKKNHKCRKCGTEIASGDMYYEKKVMTRSYMFYSKKYCTKCYKETYENIEG